MSSQPRRPHAWFIPSSVANPEEPFTCFRCDLAADYDGHRRPLRTGLPGNHTSPRRSSPGLPGTPGAGLPEQFRPGCHRAVRPGLRPGPGNAGCPGSARRKMPSLPRNSGTRPEVCHRRRRRVRKTVLLRDLHHCRPGTRAAYREGLTEGKAAAKRIIGRLIDQGTDPGPDDRCCALKITHRHCRFCAGAILAASSAGREYETEVCRSCCLAVLEIASGS